jgi:adenosylcobinamide-phosphate synthase
MWRTDLLQFLFAVGLDVLVGDPQGWPHVTRTAGALCGPFEMLWSRTLGRTVFSGMMLWLSVCGSLLAGYLLVRNLLSSFGTPVAWLWDAFIIYQTLAARDLDTHARAVANPLLLNDLDEARLRVGAIVGRDTHNLNASEISRAAVEAVAESTTDGFVAPLFWAAVGGAPAALLYRATNTLDSIVGHRTPRYELMGKFSAIADDVLGYLPARLCALASLLPRGFRYFLAVLEDSAKHASPNAGWSEAAAAWALGVRLGGVNYYDGVPQRGPVFNTNARPAQPGDVLRVLRWFWGVALLCVVVLAAGLQARQWLTPKPVVPPPLPQEIPKPDFNRKFEPLPPVAPVKIKGQISNGNDPKP